VGRGRFAIGAVGLVLTLSAAGCGSKSSTSTTASTSTTSTAPLTNPVVVATLHGSSETTNGAPGGSGTARITLNPKTGEACWTLTYTGIGKPLSAHVHKGAAGEDGPVVIPLGDVYANKGCVLTPEASLAKVSAHPDAYYVNIHTRKQPNGAIRGQLHSP
jgi:hypothetical protein